jgi:hypothetical protein
MAIEVPPTVMDVLIRLTLALIGWAVAYVQTGKKNEAVGNVTAVTEYFTDGNVKAPEGVAIPSRSIKMNQETKDFVTNGESDADKVKMLEQISTAEAEGKTEYLITYSKGYYKVQWGLVYGSAQWG